MTEVEIRRASDTDLPAVHALLVEHGLPVPDPVDAPVNFVVAVRDDTVVGVTGWEAHDREALLRSVAVADSGQHKGVGSRLVEEALRMIADAGFPRVTLVTMDAAAFFSRFSFAPIRREDVPDPIRSCTEYRIHECVGGQWMRRGSVN